MKHIYFTLALLIVANITLAQAPDNYYSSATGTGYTLKTQLSNIIDNNNDGLSPEYLSTDPGYGALYTTYLTSDVDLYYENNGSVLDMYTENPTGADIHEYFYNSNPSQQDMGSGGTAEGQFYNREHIIPQSTFSSASPMRSDAHFVVPSDKYVNGQRGNSPFGTVASASNTYSNGSRRGTSAVMGYSGTVFEPIDEFKGDIARMHFYFATRYESTVAGYNYDMFNNTSDQVFEDAFLALLLQWHNNDPVSQREKDRNNAIFNAQNNRNPFIDNPSYVNSIWGGSTDTQAPTTPTNLVASNPTATTVDLTWTASTDDTAVTTYDVYVDGVFYVTTNSNATTFTVTGLTPETMYSFTILARDAAGNSSALSMAASSTTLAGPPAGTDCVGEDFENIPASASSYATRTWTGVDGIANGWTATDARTDQTLNTRSICVRNGTLTSPSISGGIQDLTVTTQLTFSGSAGTFDVLVNGVSVGSVPYSSDNSTPTTTTIQNINIEGNISVVLDNQSTSNRVRIDDLSWTCYTVPTDIKLSAKAYLQGSALNRSTVSGEEDWMRDDLRVNGLIPTTSPYDATTCDAAVFNTTGSDAIVDWILVELRDAINNTSVIESQSALLQRDGDIVAVDGVSNLSFTSTADSYYIAIKHRNHLGIMTANTVALSNTSTVVDFKDNNNQITFGTNAQTSFGMPTAIVAMWSGNVNNDTLIQYSGTNPDSPSILSEVLNDVGNFLNFPTYIVSGYNIHDVNMDGDTQYTGTLPDTPFILQNVLSHPGNFLNFSTYQILEQLPEN